MMEHSLAEEIAYFEKHPDELEVAARVDDLRKAIKTIAYRQERYGNIWAGFLIKELRRISIQDGNQLIDLMVKLNFIQIKKVPNPKDSDFPTSMIELNRDERFVRDVLNESEEQCN